MAFYGGIMKVTKKAVLSAAAALIMMISGCAADTDSAVGGTSEVSSTTMESDTPMDTNFSFLPSAETVKLIGRTAEDEGILWLALSASGIEFTFTGTSATVDIVGDNMISNGKDKQARFAIYVDGEKTLDAQVDAEAKTYEICSFDEARETTVKILKLSEAAESTFGIRNITVNGTDVKPTGSKELKIEFIGDSITCGYGVDDEVKEHHFSTSTEDATRAYAYKAAQLLDADYSLVSYSGHGIISGYTTNGKKVKGQLVPPVYEQFAKSYGSYGGIFNVSSIDWNFGSFRPDFVVINLGTNDASYCGNDPEKIEDYAVSYAEFLKVVREHNPDAHIICALGVMGDSLYKNGVCKAVELYTTETGDTAVSSLRLTPQNGSTGYAADWHPTEATHEIAANELADEIKRLMAE